MMICTLGRLRVRVDERSRQPGDGVQEAVLGINRHLMRLDSAGICIDDDFALGPKLMTDPAQTHLANVQNPGGGSQDLLRLVDERGVDGVHQTAVDLLRRLSQYGQDRERDQQSDNRICPIPAHGHTCDTEQDSQ